MMKDKTKKGLMIILWICWAIYLVMPVDLLMDYIPVVGVIDDIAIGTLLFVSAMWPNLYKNSYENVKNFLKRL